MINLIATVKPWKRNRQTGRVNFELTYKISIAVQQAKIKNLKTTYSSSLSRSPSPYIILKNSWFFYTAGPTLTKHN